MVVVGFLQALFAPNAAGRAQKNFRQKMTPR